MNEPGEMTAIRRTMQRWDDIPFEARSAEYWYYNIGPWDIDFLLSYIDTLTAEVTDLRSRCEAAESRYADLAAAIDEDATVDDISRSWLGDAPAGGKDRSDAE